MQRPAERTSKPGWWWWAAALVLTLLVVQLIPMLFYHRYYFTGDTQNAYYGWWYYLGDHLRHGSWPILDPQAWRGGNMLAEGQVGLFSPLLMLIGLGATVAPNAVLYVVVVKTALTITGGLGAFALARHYGTTLWAATVLGVAVPLTGSVQLLDSPSWVAGQMAACLLPWLWWGFRRVMYQQAMPWVVLVVGYLIVTIGYVYGTFYFAIVAFGCLVECLVRRDRAAFLRVLLPSIACALVAAAVYLPGILTSPVTVRSSWDIIPVGRMQGDVGGLLISMVPVSALATYYVAWFLPMLVWLDGRLVRARLRDLSGALVILVVMAMWIFGPNQVGPIRWPTRSATIYDLAALLVVMVLLSTCLRARPSPARLLVSLAITAAASYAVLWRAWEHAELVLLAGALSLLGMVLIWLVVRRTAPEGDDQRGGARPRRLPALAYAAAPAVVLVTVGLGLQVIQHQAFPRPAAFDRNSPANRSDYRTQLAGARGDTMVVGNPEPASLRSPVSTREMLIANSWFLNPHPVANVDSAAGFRAYSNRFCMDYLGTTCPRALTAVVRHERTTHLRWLDLMSISTLVVARDGSHPKADLRPPKGWHIARVAPHSVMWVRDAPVPTAGGVVWSSDGVGVRMVSNSDRQAVFEVVRAPASGGKVVLSRLAWPGYRVSGARLGSPLRATLLTVGVTRHDVGHTVTVRFDPPRWNLLLGCLWVGVGFGVLLCLPWRRLRRRRTAVGDRVSVSVPVPAQAEAQDEARAPAQEDVTIGAESRINQ